MYREIRNERFRQPIIHQKRKFLVRREKNVNLERLKVF